MMAGMHVLPPFDPNGDSTSLSQRWETWNDGWFQYHCTQKETSFDVTFWGDALHKVFDTQEDTGDDNNYVKGRDALHAVTFCAPPKKVILIRNNHVPRPKSTTRGECRSILYKIEAGSGQVSIRRHRPRTHYPNHHRLPIRQTLAKGVRETVEAIRID